jgi:acetylornithine deacetylase/succinyl-diaminopimelate desuccinylase-like protein
MTTVSDNLQPVFAHIEAQEENFVQRLMDYVRHPSISAHNIGIREVAEILVNHMRQLGMEAEAVPTSNHPMVLGKRIVSPDKPTVMFYGHYDVQPADPLELWTTPPFEPTIRNGRIYARGVGDNKGQHYAQLLAIESYLAVNGELPCNVIVLLEGEEEIGSPHIAEFIEEHAHRLKADLVITSDGPLHSSGAPIITFGARGIVSFELRVKTASRDVHSGNFGGVVPNAIWTLVHLLSTMKNVAGEITIDGITDMLTPPTNREREAVANLPINLDEVKADLALSRLDAPADRGYYDRLMFHPTLTVNGIHGGYSGPGTKTVLPCEAFAKCDMRLVHPLTPEYVYQKVAEHVEKHAPEVEFVRQNSMLPSKTSLDSPFVEPVRRAVVHARGMEALLYPTMPASFPDYVFTETLGLPSFGVPYANADEANHAPNENMEIVRFIDGIRTGAAILAEVGAMKRRASRTMAKENC